MTSMTSMTSTQLKWPKPLTIGSKIAIVSPAGAIKDLAILDDTKKKITAKEYKPELGPHVDKTYQNHYRYAGTVEERLKDLQWALDDNSIDAIWATRGGYGCVQLLEKINPKKFLDNPKWFIGHSDNTYLQSYLAQHGVPSIHGQNVIQTTNTPSLKPVSYEKIFDILAGKKLCYEIKKNSHNQKGSAEGILIGGNLTIVAALLGTKYDFSYKGAILFIEEIGENGYYKIDRYMQSLELSGALSKIKGIVVGGMKNIGGAAESYDDKAYKIIAENVNKYNIPKIFGFPNGHIADTQPLIIGATVTITVGDEKTTLKYNNQR